MTLNLLQQPSNIGSFGSLNYFSMPQTISTNSYHPSYNPGGFMTKNDDSSKPKIPGSLKSIIKGGAKAMLGIACNLDIDVRKVQYPVYFEKRNVCVHCAAEGSLVFVDVFGRETNREINSFEHIKCKCCGRTYSINWKNDPANNSKMYPVAVDPSVSQQFSNFMNMRDIKRKGVNDYY